MLSTGSMIRGKSLYTTIDILFAIVENKQTVVETIYVLLYIKTNPVLKYLIHLIMYLLVARVKEIPLKYEKEVYYKIF
ncbi:MAG: hypothetical protein N4A50_01575 [Vallitalea sp.]|jgi:hypothetical protein|nr:hypothetical protein [Vallitalea sp.]